MVLSERDHGFHPLRVTRVIAETEDAISLALDVPPDLAEAFAYRAGQFITFRLAIDGGQQLRSYSMSSAPEVDEELRVTVKRVDGGVVSTWLTRTLTPGDTLEATRPAGVFTLRETDATGDLVAFAAGSGITPVFSLLKAALATTSRRVRLLYANRDNSAIIFREQLRALSAQYGERLQVVHHLDSHHGFVQSEDIGHFIGADDADYFICGPAPFMKLVEATLQSHDIESGRIHIERFTPSSVPVEVTTLTPAPDVDPAPTQITICLNGKTLTAAHRRGTTVLQTARSMGLSPPFSCEAGDCATCMAKVIEGAADMFVNNALLPEEVTEGWILTCQAVPTTPSIRVEYEQ